MGKKSLEPLPSSPPDESSPKTERPGTVNEVNMVRATFKSGTAFEGQLSHSIPHGDGKLIFGNGGVSYQVISFFWRYTQRG